jgi:hypothetical protein
LQTNKQLDVYGVKFHEVKIRPVSSLLDASPHSSLDCYEHLSMAFLDILQ